MLLLESAFVLPFLLLFTLAIVQYGLLFHAILALQYTCREGARYTSVYGRTRSVTVGGVTTTADDTIKARMVKVGRDLGVKLSASDIVIGPQAVNPAVGTANRLLYDNITVTINYPLSRKTFVTGTFSLMGTPVKLPLLTGTYSVAETVLLEGSQA